MYNGPLVNTEAPFVAERVRRESGSRLLDQIHFAFQLTLGRRPSSSEVDQLKKFYEAAESESDGLTSICRVLLNTNEFVYVD